MKIRRYWLSALMCVLVSAASTSSSAQPFQIVSGKVQSSEQAVTAGDNGALVRLSPGVTLRLAPGTRMQKLNRRTKLWLSAKGTTLTHLVALEHGRVEVENKDASRAVLVRTPLGLSGVARSGRLGVLATPTQVSFTNLGGSVLWATSNLKFKTLEQGRVRTISKAEDTETARVAAPAVTLEHNLFGGFAGAAEVSGVSWQPIAGAASYVVNIEELGAKRRPPTQITTTVPQLSPPPQLGAGRYSLSVRALDRFGVESDSSNSEPFTVVGVHHTRGGYVDAHGNIVAGYDRRLQFTHAEGLSLRATQGDWGPVPSEIALSSAAPANLYLRQNGDARTLTARVMAQPVRTLLSVGPKLLRWPGPNAQIEVRFAGPEGQPAPTWIEPRFRVRLGIDELDVAWTRVGDKFVTEVPSRTGQGPWIVRVEVEDQYGHSLGRDFVEIERQEPSVKPQPLPAQASR